MSVTEKPSLWARRGVLCLALVVSAAGARAEDGKAAVHIDNFAFVPMELKIKKGTEVVWTNNDDIPHTVLSVGTNIRSKTMDTEGTFIYKFDKAGTFNYICALHPHMKAKVVVTE
jgi:plastocyanin